MTRVHPAANEAEKIFDLELLGVVRFKTKTVPFAVEGTRGLAGGGFGV
jgi:hypothetical protein